MMRSEPGQPLTILLLEPDDDTRPLLKQNLEKIGYQVLVSIDESDAIQRSIYGPPADLILINQVDLSIEEAVALGHRIRAGASVSPLIPVVILAENYTTYFEGQNVQVGEHDYIAYLENAQQLFDLLEGLLHRD